MNQERKIILLKRCLQMNQTTIKNMVHHFSSVKFCEVYSFVTKADASPMVQAKYVTQEHNQI